MQGTINENKLLTKKHIIMAMKIKMVNVYNQKETTIYSDNEDFLLFNLLEIFCIKEDDIEEKSFKDVTYITTNYIVEISEELHERLIKAISDIKRRTINKIIISSMFGHREVQNTIIERK